MMTREQELSALAEGLLYHLAGKQDVVGIDAFGKYQDCLKKLIDETVSHLKEKDI